MLSLPSLTNFEAFRAWRADTSRWVPAAIDIARGHGLSAAAPHIFATGTNLVLALDHRVETQAGRGSPETPGLVLGLDRGGCCAGAALHVAAHLAAAMVAPLGRLNSASTASCLDPVGVL